MDTDEYFNSFIVFGITNITGEQLREICENNLKNIFYVQKRYPLKKLTGENIWKLNPFNDRSWSFWLHSLVMVEHLVRGYKEFNNLKYLLKAKEIILDWKKHNFPVSVSDMAWHDHSTALRSIVICQFAEVWRNFKGDDMEVTVALEELIGFHSDKLADDSFYMEKHNHGLDQDIALFIITTIFTSIKDVTMLREKSLSRFWRQINNLFSEDGSYLEHSPHYSYLLLERLFKFLNLLKLQKINDYIKLETVLSKQIKFLTNTLYPNGLIPPIGDSEIQQINLNKLYNAPEYMVKELKYIVSNAVEGQKPKYLDVAYPKGGYVIMRNTWQSDHNTVQVVFINSFHSRVHKHHDDLSFNVYGHNQPLLIDAGKYNYMYDSPGRKFVISQRAHNTVVVDNENSDTKRLNIGKSGLTNYYLGEEFSFVSGIHCLYPGVVHRRLLLYLKPYDLIVFDILNGYKDHNFEQCFNFYPNIECRFNKGSLFGNKDGDSTPIIKISQIYNERLIESQLYKGEKDPLKGWCSLEYSKLEPTYSLSSLQVGKDAQYATHISLNPQESYISALSWDDDVVNVSFKEKSFKIILSDIYCHLLLNGKFVEINKIVKPKLVEAVREARQYEYREKYRSERNRRIRYQEQMRE